MKRLAKTRASRLGAAVPAAKKSAVERLASLDAFRGLVILTMIFVNYIQSKGTPKWLLHVASGVDGYTVTDVVFPAFLFIVGVAIPLSLGKRIALGDSLLLLLRRIFERTASLLFLGLIMVNHWRFSAKHTGMSSALWYLLAYLCVIALWNIYPKVTTDLKKKIFLGLRIGAALLLLYLVIIWRGRGPDGGTWLRPQWWGILGIIGWTYMAASLSYLVCRGNSTALMGVMSLMIALYMGGKHGVLNFLGPINNVINVGGTFGSHSAIVVAGMLVGILFTRKETSHFYRLRFMSLFGLGLFFAGTLIRPLHGINKIGGTDAYALVTAGECCLLFMVFYYLMDVLQWRRWASFLQPIGFNPLLAYILPSIVGAIIGFFGAWGTFWFWYARGGIHRLANAMLMTGLILLITWGMTRLKIVLKL